MRRSHIHKNTKRHRDYASGGGLSTVIIAAMAKRTLQINVRMSNDDLALLKKAAQALWPGLELSTSTAVLSLAKKAAEEALHAKPKK
jgi:predicted DNA binding CopG/RHH family protein